MDAIKATCGFAEGRYVSPSLALKFGNLLKTCALILQGDSYSTRDKELRGSMKSFIGLLDNSYRKRVSAFATIQLRRER